MGAAPVEPLGVTPSKVQGWPGDARPIAGTEWAGGSNAQPTEPSYSNRR